MPELLYDHIVVRYGELSTKGKNKKDFTRQLTNNIKRRLADFSDLEYKTLHDGLFIKLNNESFEEISEYLKTIFGYSYFAGCILVEKDMDALKEVTLALAKKKDYKTFKIQTRRADKSYPMRSDEITRLVASNILKNTYPFGHLQSRSIPNVSHQLNSCTISRQQYALLAILF